MYICTCTYKPTYKPTYNLFIRMYIYSTLCTCSKEKSFNPRPGPVLGSSTLERLPAPPAEYVYACHLDVRGSWLKSRLVFVFFPLHLS